MAATAFSDQTARHNRPELCLVGRTWASCISPSRLPTVGRRSYTRMGISSLWGVNRSIGATVRVNQEGAGSSSSPSSYCCWCGWQSHLDAARWVPVLRRQWPVGDFDGACGLVLASRDVAVTDSLGDEPPLMLAVVPYWCHQRENPCTLAPSPNPLCCRRFSLYQRDPPLFSLLRESRGGDSNPEPPDYKSGALPVELPRQDRVIEPSNPPAMGDYHRTR